MSEDLDREAVESDGPNVLWNLSPQAEAARRHVQDTLIPQLLEAVPQGVQQTETPFELPELSVQPQQLRQVAEWLQKQGFNMLLDVGGVDYLPREPRFEVVYHFLAIPALWKLRVRVALADDGIEIPSLSGLWPAAINAEREVFDLFGLRFSDHPDLTRILMPDDWEGYPLRKDYPLQGPRALQSTTPPAEVNWYHPPRRPGAPTSPPKRAYERQDADASDEAEDDQDDQEGRDSL